MEDGSGRTGGWRGTPEGWLAEAERALIAGGIEAVRPGALAEAMGLSRTSFYGHFPSREALLDALIARWEAKNTGGLIGRATAFAESLPEAVYNLFDCWLDPGLFDARLDMAVRGWATADAALWPRVQAADRARIAAIGAMLMRFGVPAGDSDVRACTIYYTQIGYFALRVEEDIELRLTRMPAYVAAFCGMPPSATETARFRARHGR